MEISERRKYFTSHAALFQIPGLVYNHHQDGYVGFEEYRECLYNSDEKEIQTNTQGMKKLYYWAEAILRSN